MKVKKNLLKILFFIIFLNIQVDSFALTKNKIIMNVENQIISSYELKNKIRIILFLSNQELNQDNVNFTKKKALQQLIDYKLKKNQVIKFNIQGGNQSQINNYLNNLSAKYQTDIIGIKTIFKNNELDFELYLDEIKTEFNWQQLVFSRFKNKVSVNEKEVSNELENLLKVQDNLKEYKLAEIEISLNNNSEDKNIILEVNNKINEIGFEKTAIKYSISTSSLDGGNIGWINSKSLSKKILDIVDKMKIGNVSKPIIEKDRATILKLLDKKTLDVGNLDLDQLRQQIIKNKQNELLNLYSNNYLSKIKNNALIEVKWKKKLL